MGLQPAGTRQRESYCWRRLQANQPASGHMRSDAGWFAALKISCSFAFPGCGPEGKYNKGDKDVPRDRNRASNDKSQRHHDNDAEDNVKTASAECFHRQSPPKTLFASSYFLKVYSIITFLWVIGLQKNKWTEAEVHHLSLFAVTCEKAKKMAHIAVGRCPRLYINSGVDVYYFNK